jgi:hypothetical protein
MSTHAVFQFIDEDLAPFNVYVHHDGYHSGAASKLRITLDCCWPLPDWEASEFAAAFVAANKRAPGGVYLLHPDADLDCGEYVYAVFNTTDGLKISISYPRLFPTGAHYIDFLANFLANPAQADKYLKQKIAQLEASS